MPMMGSTPMASPRTPHTCLDRRFYCTITVPVISRPMCSGANGEGEPPGGCACTPDGAASAAAAAAGGRFLEIENE